MEGRKLENPEKNPRSKARTNNKLNAHMALGWNQTGATLVGGECSHHCAIPAPQLETLLESSFSYNQAAKDGSSLGVFVEYAIFSY